MNPLPHFSSAIVDLRKLRDYCLNPDHPRGRHKARVFRAALGLDQRDAEWLALFIKSTLPKVDAVDEATDRFGTRWRTDITVVRNGRYARMRVLWLVPPNGAPRLLTCYIA